MRYKPTLITIEGEEIGIAPVVAKAAGVVFKIGRRVADKIAQRVRDKRRAKDTRSQAVTEQVATNQNTATKTRNASSSTKKTSKNTALLIVGAGVAVATLAFLSKKRK